MSLNPMYRTIENLVETNCLGITADMVKGKKLFQIVKYVTGKKVSKYSDYELTKMSQYYGYDSEVIKGTKGFIRVTLEPLFEAI